MSECGMGLHLHIISRKKAKALGMRHYFTGKPCKRGGIGPRNTKSRHCACPYCSEATSEASARFYAGRKDEEKERVRLWKENNKEASREYNRNYMRKRRAEKKGPSM